MHRPATCLASRSSSVGLPGFAWLPAFAGIDSWSSTERPLNDQTTHTPQALAGVTILDFSHLLQGPFATQLLADMGANVIKVERPARATCSAR